MHWLFTFLTCFIIITGESVMKMKSGEDLKLIFKTPKNNISRLTVVKDGQIIYCYCSPEERGRGCEDINSRNISLQSSEGSVNLNFPEAEGVYNAKLICKDGSVNTSIYDLEPRFNSASPTTQSIIKTADAVTGNTNSHNAVTGINGGIIGGIIGGICLLGVILCVVICKRKEIKEYCNNCEARDKDCEQGNPLRSVSGGEPNADCIEMDETNHSVDSDNQHSNNMVNGACRALIN